LIITFHYIMGTRGLLGFIIKGKKIGTYTRWDSYPEILGQRIVDFILSLDMESRKLMIENLQKVSS
jgi:hypothetical protein